MAENKRVRIEPDIETYLRSQSERVLSKPGTKVTVAELGIITNRIIYEHKLGQSLASRFPLAKLFDWITSLVPGKANLSLARDNAANLAPISQKVELEDFALDAALADQFDEAA
ncbi:MAG: hypothetical protein F6J92_22615 [Symploca sp. SIO1A3]|nr:hypothetical protein [Symploca sp. SIO1A3]